MPRAAIDPTAVVLGLGTRSLEASELVKRVLTVIHIVADGIQNAPIDLCDIEHQATNKVTLKWFYFDSRDPAWITSAALSSHKPDTLIRLVLFADAHDLRVAIAPHSTQALRLTFSTRTRDGEPSESPGVAALASRWGLMEVV